MIDSEETNMCLLVQPTYLPIPEGITVIDNYGHESIKGSETGDLLASGDVCIVIGTASAIRTWLKPFDEIWVTTSPMIGQWETYSVKDHG